MNVKMTEEDWKMARLNCVSCGTGLLIKDFPQCGNYCRKCCSLAKAMSDARKHSNEELTKDRLNRIFIHYDRPDLIGKESIMADLKLLLAQ